MTDEELVAKYERIKAQRIHGRGEEATQARHARRITLQDLKKEIKERGLRVSTRCNAWVGTAKQAA